MSSKKHVVEVRELSVNSIAYNPFSVKITNTLILIRFYVWTCIADKALNYSP